ncbi:MAG: hypothetical protein DMF63_02820 [Acidobacteria bacterium]|nr:MAG: hypothetical protein DMF63_02820 [Acidobacteriota bacterium]
MCYTGLFKRFVPFFLTFAAGLFIASFFVSIGLPGSGFRGGNRFNKFQEMQRLRVENEELRERLRQSRLENEELRRVDENMDLDFVMPDAVPPVDFDAHHPPAPPKRPKNPRFE